jgi:antitoxin (DNA-binding transcriptional repressor) of toxin-antitoxin stability system
MVMIMVNIFEAKAKLSEYLEAVAGGERVLICNRNRPVAELRALAPAAAERRLGTAAGAVTIGETFNDPLPDDLLAAFEGGAPVRARAPKVAETPATHSARKPGKARTRRA